MRSVVRLVLFAGIILTIVTGFGCAKTPVIDPFVPSPDLEVKPEEVKMPFQFAGIKSGLRRGTTVGVKYGRYTNKGDHAICNLDGTGLLKWQKARDVIGTGSDEFGVEFFHAMNDKGYNVVNDPEALYDSNKRLARAPLEVAATVKAVFGLVCERYSVWDYRPLMTSDVEMDILVEWVVYDRLLHEKKLTVVTRGYVDVVDELDIDFTAGIYEAFGVAAEELANNKKFRDVMSQEITVTSEGDAAELERPKESVTIPFVPLSKKLITDNPTRFQMSAVVINGDAGHGSGYVIGQNGLIISNAHVVGKAETVRVRFFEGYEVPGKVVRKNVARDVSLIKVDMNGLYPLAVRPEPAKVAERVYAIGAPKRESFGWTVSSGIVSALRMMDGQKMIQADVDIHGGNSGGPLLDEHGNLVGMSVCGWYMFNNKTSSGINGFIPIHEALKMLNIQIEKQ